MGTCEGEGERVVSGRPGDDARGALSDGCRRATGLDGERERREGELLPSTTDSRELDGEIWGAGP